MRPVMSIMISHKNAAGVGTMVAEDHLRLAAGKVHREPETLEHRPADAAGDARGLGEGSGIARQHEGGVVDIGDASQQRLLARQVRSKGGLEVAAHGCVCKAHASFNANHQRIMPGGGARCTTE